MAYNFSFDFSKMSQSFFKEIAKFAENGKINEKIGNATNYTIKKFNLDKITGIPITELTTVIRDMIDVQLKNLVYREAFLKTKKRAIFLPHCSRKYMDCRCKASFDPKMSSYTCMACSSDCLINKATKMAKKKGYDVYVVPGGSGVRKILEHKSYEAILGVACTEEMKLASKMLEQLKIPGQAVPLTKNGCCGTKFSLETLEKTL